MRLLERGGEGRGVPNCAGSCPRPQILPPSPPPQMLPPPPSPPPQTLPPPPSPLPIFLSSPKSFIPPSPLSALSLAELLGGSRTPPSPLKPSSEEAPVPLNEPQLPPPPPSSKDPPSHCSPPPPPLSFFGLFLVLFSFCLFVSFFNFPFPFPVNLS